MNKQIATINPPKLATHTADEQVLKFLEKTQRAGTFHYLITRTKIQTIKQLHQENPQQLAQVVGISLNKAHTLGGFKDEISPLDKEDIKGLLLTRYNHLKISDIDYAFRLERYGELGEHTAHFQLFNAEYVTKVLFKFEKWEAQQKKANPQLEEQIKRQKLQQEEPPEKSPEEALLELFPKYCQNAKKGETLGFFSVFELLWRIGEIRLNDQQKQEIKRRATEIIAVEEMQDEQNPMTRVRRWLEVGNGANREAKINQMARNIAVERYFKSVENVPQKLEQVRRKLEGMKA